MGLMVYGCNGSHKLKKVRLKIDWLPSAEYYGIFYAKYQKWFREAGIDMEIESSTGAPQVAAELAAGTLLVGTTSSGQVLQNITDDEIKYVRCVPLVKFNPTAIISLKRSPVNGLSELPGTKLGVNVSSVTYKQYTYIMDALGIDKGLVSEIPIGWGGASFLLNGQVKSLLHYLTNVGVDLMIEVGKDQLEIIRLDKLQRNAIFTYGTVLCFAKQPKSKDALSNREIDDITKIIERGYAEGSQNIDLAVAAIKSAEPTLSSEKLRMAIELIVKLNNESTVTPAQVDTWMNMPTWKYQRAVSLYKY